MIQSLKNQTTKVATRRFGSLPLLLILILVSAFLAYVFFVPQAVTKPDDTWTGIQNTHVVRIGIDPSSPPFIVDDGTGKLSGFDVALANELATRWGVTIQYVYTGFDGLYDALNGKQFDMILSALPYNPDKTQDVYFSRAYFNDGPILIVRGEDTTSAGLGALQGKTIGVELGSNGDGVARKWQKRYALNLKQFDTSQAALGALEKGEVNAAVVDAIALIDFRRENPGSGAESWRVVGDPLADENYIIAVRRDSPTLLQEINKVIDELRRDGKLQEMQKENF